MTDREALLEMARPHKGAAKVAVRDITVGREELVDKAMRNGILVWLTLQNAIHTLLIRYSRARVVEEMFCSSVAVFLTEIIKLVICLLAILVQEKPRRFLSLVRERTIGHPWDTLKVCVPAMIYIVQNNLFYVAASHLEAATFMVTSQLKIFTTALFSVLLMGRSLSGTQWTALVILFAGVSLVQLQSVSSPKADEKQSPLIGFGSIILASCLSGFAGVYFEKILKNAQNVSVSMRNVQMALFGIPASMLSIYAQDGPFVMEHGLLYGFDGVVWLTAFWYAVGGLSVAACIKYADNIAKNFATSVAIILSTLGSVWIFGFVPSYLFISGASLVILSIFTYSSSYPILNAIPRQLRFNLCL